MLEQENKESFLHHEFSYGRKTISVDVNLANSTASIRIGTVAESWKRKQLGETTAVFLLADWFIQEVANHSQKSITLVFGTSNHNIKVWARTRKEILSFDAIEPENLDSYQITVKKTYLPSSTS